MDRQDQVTQTITKNVGVCPSCHREFTPFVPPNWDTMKVECPNCGKTIQVDVSVEYLCTSGVISDD